MKDQETRERDGAFLTERARERAPSGQYPYSLQVGARHDRLVKGCEQHAQEERGRDRNEWFRDPVDDPGQPGEHAQPPPVAVREHPRPARSREWAETIDEDGRGPEREPHLDVEHDAHRQEGESRRKCADGHEERHHERRCHEQCREAPDQDGHGLRDRDRTLRGGVDEERDESRRHGSEDEHVGKERDKRAPVEGRRMAEEAHGGRSEHRRREMPEERRDRRSEDDRMGDDRADSAPDREEHRDPAVVGELAHHPRGYLRLRLVNHTRRAAAPADLEVVLVDGLAAVLAAPHVGYDGGCGGAGFTRSIPNVCGKIVAISSGVQRPSRL